MKTWLIGLTIAALAATLAPTDAFAKRLGGGKSTGMQRDMPARTAPDAAPGKPANAAPAGPQQAGQSAAVPAGATAAAAAPAKRSWMGPLAGLAAGLGLAALMSHLGLGEGFANFLLIALLAVAAFFVIRLVMRRFASPPAVQPAGAGAAVTPRAAQVAWPAAGSGSNQAGAPLADTTTPEPAVPAPVAPAVAKAFVPASFDHEGFERAAKLIFIRLQAANDTADLDDLRSFTTPEMFASIRLDLQERGATSQHTDVLRVEPKVIDIGQDGERQVVSVRFQGELREEAGAAPVAFDEVWHLVKPLEDHSGASRNWAIAGIEQMA